MKKYMFTTQGEMIDENYYSGGIRDKVISGESLSDVFDTYISRLLEEDGVSVSNNSFYNIRKIYRDKKGCNSYQVGYLLKGKMHVENELTHTYVEKYLNLWIEIIELVDPDFREFNSEFVKGIKGIDIE